MRTVPSGLLLRGRRRAGVHRARASLLPDVAAPVSRGLPQRRLASAAPKSRGAPGERRPRPHPPRAAGPVDAPRPPSPSPSPRRDGPLEPWLPGQSARPRGAVRCRAAPRT
eukprot:scaffold674_cov371-Prasinococcus_capsulatus_cf.AAC.5